MTYTRVLPRDLFNEANLLKMMGRLVLLIEDGDIEGMSYHHDGDAFNICQNPSNGALFIGNLQFFILGPQGHALTIERPLNSREPWALWVEGINESFPVFDETGEFILDIEAVKKDFENN